MTKVFKYDFRVIIKVSLILILLFLVLFAIFRKEPEPKYNEYVLSPSVCNAIFGVEPDVFLATKGSETDLFNGYSEAKVDQAGNLILHLTDAQREAWKNSSAFLQILQKIVGEERKIVSKIIPPTNEIHQLFYEGAESCGFEISEDYSKVIAGPGDDKSYILFVPQACLMMRVLEDGTGEEHRVEYREVDAQGDTTVYHLFPMPVFMFQDIDECKQLMSYEQIEVECMEFDFPSHDTFYRECEYQEFWGLDYKSSTFEYEIFAYEFSNRDDALAYYMRASEQKESDLTEKQTQFFWVWSSNEYRIVVVSENKVYNILSSEDTKHHIKCIGDSSAKQKEP